MKLSHMALAALVTVGGATGISAVNAASPDYVDPQLCVADVGKLDANGDGYVDSREYPNFSKIESDVDVNGDGRISAEERTVACKKGAVDALEGKHG